GSCRAISVVGDGTGAGVEVCGARVAPGLSFFATFLLLSPRFINTIVAPTDSAINNNANAACRNTAGVSQPLASDCHQRGFASTAICRGASAAIRTWIASHISLVGSIAVCS